MTLLGLLGLGLLATGAVDAPITSVTVYSDRVRVVRTARLTLSRTQRVELPLLRGGVDASSVRIEAKGAEVARVDLRPVSTEAITPAEVRKVLDERASEAHAHLPRAQRALVPTLRDAVAPRVQPGEGVLLRPREPGDRRGLEGRGAGAQHRHPRHHHPAAQARHLEDRPARALHPHARSARGGRPGSTTRASRD